MSDEDENGQDERKTEKSTIGEQHQGFHLEAGLRLLSDLLGDLVEVNISNAPPPPEKTEEAVEWANTDETGVELQRSESTSESKRKRTKHVRESPAEQCLIDTRLTDGELTITADMPGASKDDISVGHNPRTNKLVISKDGTVVGRVVLPWESVETTKVWFNNGVLEIHMRPKES